MIAEVSIGTAVIPESAPADPVVVVVPIAPTMTNNTYTVSLLLPAELPSADVVVTSQTTTDVTLTVTRPDGYAGSGLTVFVICTQAQSLDDGWVDVSAFLDPGWTGTALLRRVASIVYFWFELTATATIDGTPKTDEVAVLDVEAFDPIWVDITSYAPLGGCYTDGNEPIRALFRYPVSLYGSNVFVEGAAGATGDWTDGVSTLFGQIEWVSGSGY